MKINIIGVIFAVLILINSSFALASSYSFIHQNGKLIEYSYFGNLFFPFSGYVSMNQCLNELGKANNNSEIEMVFIDSDCSNKFIYNVVNYIQLNKKDLIILYDSDADIQELKAIHNFSEKFNMQAFKQSDFPNKSLGVIFIGNSQRIINTLDKDNLSAGKSIIYINEEKSIIISGSGNAEVISSISLLTEFYNNYFDGKRCVIFNGCEIKKETSVKELVNTFIDWRNGNIDLKSFVKKISEWRNS